MKIDSTAIRSIDYAARDRRLLVRFQSGERYAYDRVPAEVHRSFIEAESKGRFFQAEILGRYPYRRLDS